MTDRYELVQVTMQRRDQMLIARLIHHAMRECAKIGKVHQEPIEVTACKFLEDELLALLPLFEAAQPEPKT